MRRGWWGGRHHYIDEKSFVNSLFGRCIFKSFREILCDSYEKRRDDHYNDRSNADVSFGMSSGFDVTYCVFSNRDFFGFDILSVFFECCFVNFLTDSFNYSCSGILFF